MVRISGSHPGGPGSIPGNGILFGESLLKIRLRQTAEEIRIVDVSSQETNVFSVL